MPKTKLHKVLRLKPSRDREKKMTSHTHILTHKHTGHQYHQSRLVTHGNKTRVMEDWEGKACDRGGSHEKEIKMDKRVETKT